MAAATWQIQFTVKCRRVRRFASGRPGGDCMRRLQLFGFLARRVVGEPKECSIAIVV